MNKIKIAQIGTSLDSHGTQIWGSLLKQSDIFDVVGYALPENEREKFPERMKDFEGFREMTVEEILSDESIVAVTVETEEIYLTKYALMAAKAGKHVHMEKPGGQSLCDFERLIEAVRKSGKVFHTGYMYRYNPVITELYRQISSGELGEIISIDAQMSCYHPPKTRERVGKLKGGMSFFLGCHLIDIVYRIQGKPKNVISLNRSTGIDGVCAEDFGFAVLEYEKGVSTVKTTDVERGGFTRRSIVVVGSKKTVEIRPIERHHEGLHVTTRTDYNTENWLEAGTSYDSKPYRRYDDMMEAFAKMVRGEMINPYTAEYELELYKLIIECCGIKNA